MRWSEEMVAVAWRRRGAQWWEERVVVAVSQQRREEGGEGCDSGRVRVAWL